MIRKFVVGVLFIAFAYSGSAQTRAGKNFVLSPSLKLTQKEASHFAALALRCIQKEYPNRLNNTLEGPGDLQSPQALHPAFYGCLDWHSTVHGHWMLVRLLKLFPDLPEASYIRQVLDANLTADHILKERDYFVQQVNASFERTYGWAWLLKLAEELHAWPDSQGQQWEKNLQPLTDLVVHRFMTFLPKQTYPIRQGMHPNTAFGLAFAYDYAQTAGNDSLKRMVSQRSKDYFLHDKEAPLSWEPNGSDFLSPALEEADLMRRVLAPAEFRNWIGGFLKDFEKVRPSNMLQPAVVSDRTDMQIVHLDGLNLSRAWCMIGIAGSLGPKHALYPLLMHSAQLHLENALPNITSGQYSGEHWLASFAVYALSQEQIVD